MNHILIIGFVWPEPTSTAAGQRMLQLIQLFLSQGYKTTFISAASKTEHSINLDSLGVSTFQIQINDPSFDSFITKQSPNIVLFDRFVTEEQFGWRITKHCSNALKILNTEDLHCLRKTRQEAFKQNSSFEIQKLLNNDYAKREIASIYRCDITLMISDFEIDLLKNQFKIADNLLFYLPFLFQPINKTTQNTWPDYSKREHFITIGNFRHEPNWNSVLYLKESIWPEIRKALPKTELHIYGAYPPPKANQLNNPNQGFLIKGHAKNAKEVMSNARVCLAPIRFGAGIKGKLAEAMLCGTPSITTSIGAEGMLNRNESDWNGFITDNPSTFIKASIEIYTNQNLWKQSQQNGIEIINTRFQKDKFLKDFTNKLTEVQENLNSHRTNNFIGSMLQHHSLRSTEYMSRWIEEKNKRNNL